VKPKLKEWRQRRSVDARRTDKLLVDRVAWRPWRRDGWHRSVTGLSGGCAGSRRRNILLQVVTREGARQRCCTVLAVGRQAVAVAKPKGGWRHVVLILLLILISLFPELRYAKGRILKANCDSDSWPWRMIEQPRASPREGARTGQVADREGVLDCCHMGLLGVAMPRRRAVSSTTLLLLPRCPSRRTLLAEQTPSRGSGESGFQLGDWAPCKIA
jgi:hypothetical protein